MNLPLKLAGVQVRSSKELSCDPNLKLCGLAIGPPKIGKSTMLKSLHDAILKHEGKPSLIIAGEPADGGGLVSISDFDVPYVQPKSLAELDAVFAALSNDTNFGGVFLDNAGEIVQALVKPIALGLPSRERIESRTVGVPERSDYQTMGEMFRSRILIPLISLSKHPNIQVRKHVMMTCLPKEKTTPKGELIKVLPDLPGSMGIGAQALMQMVGGIEMTLKKSMDNGQLKTTQERSLVTRRGAFNDYSDRYNVFPPEMPLDMVAFWEKHWLPKYNPTKIEQPQQQTN